MGRRIGMGVLVVSLLAAACDDPVVATGDDLTITTTDDGFLLHNGSDAFDAVSVVVELEASALIDLVFCEGWTPRVPPGSEHLLPFDDAIGYSEDADSAVVYWCLLGEEEPVDGGSVWVAFP